MGGRGRPNCILLTWMAENDKCLSGQEGPLVSLMKKERGMAIMVYFNEILYS